MLRVYRNLCKKKIYSAEKLLPLIKETISLGEVFYLKVTGTSMTPTLYSDRDLVMLVSPKLKIPKRFDIVLFQRTNGQVVLHRIIKINIDGTIVINGDSQDWTEIIDKNQIISVVSKYVCNGKTVKCDGNIFYIKAFVWNITRKIRPYIFKILSKFK